MTKLESDQDFTSKVLTLPSKPMQLRCSSVNRPSSRSFNNFKTVAALKEGAGVNTQIFQSTFSTTTVFTLLLCRRITPITGPHDILCSCTFKTQQNLHLPYLYNGSVIVLFNVDFSSVLCGL